MSVIKRLFDIRPDELPRFSLLFAVYFVYNVGVSWSNSSVSAIILNELGADFVAQGLIFYGITTIFASIIYTAFVDRIPKHRLLVIMTAISAALVGLVFLALILGARTFAAVGLFVLSEAILLIWVLQWQTTLLDMYDTRTSKRILPLLGVGRLVGISFGGFSYPFLTTTLTLSADQIVMMWFGTLVIVLLLVWSIPRLMKDPPPTQRDGKKENILKSLTDGFVFIKQSSYLQWLAISAILMNAMIALFQYKAGVLVEDYYKLLIEDSALREAAIGNFFATIDAYSNLALLLVQLFIFPMLMNRFGLGNMNLIYPIASFFIAFGLSAGSLGLVGSSFFLFIAGNADVNRKAFRRVFRSSINGLLVNAVPSFMKGRARSVINGVIAPIAVIVVGFTSQIESDVLFTITVLLISGGYVVSAFVIKRKYAESMVQLLENKDYATLLSIDIDLGKADRQTLELLANRLRESPDAEFKRFMVAIIAEIGGREAESILMEIVDEAPETLKADYLEVMHDAEIVTQTSRSRIVAYTTSEFIPLKRISLKILMSMIALSDATFAKITAEYLHNPDYVIRLDMAVVVIQHGDEPQKERAHRVIRASLNDYDWQVRHYAIQSIVSLGDPRGIEQLIYLLDDNNDEVRLEATRAIDNLWRNTMSQELKEMVYSRQAMFLDDPVISIRHAELGILRHFENEYAHKALIKGLTDSSISIRKTSLEALMSLGQKVMPLLKQSSQEGIVEQRRMATLALAKINKRKYAEQVLNTIIENIMVIYRHHDALRSLAIAKEKPSYTILEAYYQERNQALLDESFWMLESLYGDKIKTIKETLQSHDTRTRINATEALESITSPDLARLIAPLFEPDTKLEKLSDIYRERAKLKYSFENIIEQLATGEDIWLRVIAVSMAGDLGRGNTQLIEKMHGLEATIPRKMIRDTSEYRIPTLFLNKILERGLQDRNPDVVVASRAAKRHITGRSVVQDFVKEGDIVLAAVERMIYLKQSAFFKSLNVESLKALANICDEQFLKQGEILFNQGDEGGALYIVVSGAISIGLKDNNGERVKLATYGATQAFGDMSLFDNSTRSADAVAEEDTFMLKLRRDPFLALTRQYPDLSIHLITELSERLRKANRQIAELNSSIRTNPVL